MDNKRQEQTIMHVLRRLQFINIFEAFNQGIYCTEQYKSLAHFLANKKIKH